ncbi:MAG: VOC family protein [Paracoccaceae bacterium]
MQVQLEHVNYTVQNSVKTAEMLCELFGWKVRWQGPSLNGGHTVHVGNQTSYLALYHHGTPKASQEDNYQTVGGLNHIAVTVDDIGAMESKVKGLGFTPGNQGDYEPGRRFYFHDNDGIEYEVVQYD